MEPFTEGQLSEAIVKKLLNQDVIHSIKLRNKEQSRADTSTYIYTQVSSLWFFPGRHDFTKWMGVLFPCRFIHVVGYIFYVMPTAILFSYFFYLVIIDIVIPVYISGQTHWLLRPDTGGPRGSDDRKRKSHLREWTFHLLWSGGTHSYPVHW